VKIRKHSMLFKLRMSLIKKQHTESENISSTLGEDKAGTANEWRAQT
jgi:hypothetical protein